MADDGSRAALRSCYIPVLIYTPAILAPTRGYYRELGLEIEQEQLASGTNLVPFTVSGRLDVTIGGAGADLFNALTEGHDIRLLAPFHSERPPATTPLIVRTDLYESGAVRTVADLRGRNVSAPTRGAPLFWLASALATGGLTVNDVELHFVGYREVEGAFAEGIIDASLLGEPLVEDLVERGLAVRLADDFVDGLQPTYLYCLRSTLERRRDDVVRFVAGQLRAYADLESDDPARNWDAPDTSQIIAEFTDFPGDRVPRAMRPHYDPRARLHSEHVERLYRFFADYNYVDSMPDFEPAALLEPELVAEALTLLQKDDR